MMVHQILNDTFNFPGDYIIPDTHIVLSLNVILGDQAFRLQKHILRPYSQKPARGDSKKMTFKPNVQNIVSTYKCCSTDP